MKATFLKGVALGSVVSIITLAAVSADAGTGIGGVFNLGKANSVNATTNLNGSAAGPQLGVVNKSTASKATGINVNVSTGKPPFTVNSPTKVQNLNADLLDNMDAGTFQQRVSGACSGGGSIASVNPSGSVNCSTPVVRPFVSNPVHPLPYAFYFYAPTGLVIGTACHDPGTEVFFEESGSSSATLNWMYSLNGSTSVTASGTVLQPSQGNAATFFFTSRLEGQWIFAEPGYVITVNVHGYDGGVDACEFRGTVEISPTS